MANSKTKKAYTPLVPNSRPNMLNAKPQQVIDSFGIDRKKYPIVLLGIRGYYLNEFGKPGLNDRNVHDDAIFVDIRYSTKLVRKSVCYSFNGNTDPSKIRQGAGNAKKKWELSGKGMFVLDPGVYYAHKIGKHNDQYFALVQWDENEKKYTKNEGKVKGHRDGGKKGEKNKPYPVDWGHYSINIHRGGVRTTTASAGCQTIPNTQYAEFINLIRSEMEFIFADKHETKTIPYCLVTHQQHKELLKAQKSVSKAVNDEQVPVTPTKEAAAKKTLLAIRKAAQEAETAAKKAQQAATEAKAAATEATAEAKKAAKAAAKAKALVTGK